jgi:hypothetical protein
MEVGGLHAVDERQESFYRGGMFWASKLFRGEIAAFPNPKRWAATALNSRILLWNNDFRSDQEVSRLRGT